MELKRLRSATEMLHRKMEEDLDLLRSSFTRDDYVDLLIRFHGFYRPWEAALEAAIETDLPGFFAPRRKIQNIEADLRYLGFDIEEISRIRSCGALPKLHGVGSALGSLYVIEGSTLGGRILARHFAKSLGVHPDAGGRFFAGYGERTGHMWTVFGGLLASRPATEDAAMLAAAVSTFELLGDWLGCTVYV